MKVFKTKRTNEIALEFFGDYVFITDVSKNIYPNLKTKTAGRVGELIVNCRANYYLDEENIPKEKTSKTGIVFFIRLPGVRLNNKPIYDYLKDKGVKLTLKDKKELDSFFYNLEIRKFIIKLNKSDNIEGFTKDIVETSVTFYRGIFREGEEILLRNCFDKEVVKDYFKILNIIRELSSSQDRSLYKKIDEKFDRIPFLHFTNNVLEFDKNDKELLKVKKYYDSMMRIN